MSLFKNLMKKVFGRDDTKKVAPPVAKDAPADLPPPVVDGGPVVFDEPDLDPPEVDVNSILSDKAAAHPEDLDWKRSIVDLLKLLDIDSSYSARKEMALELGYSQERIDKDGSAEMNMWLHKEVIRQFKANGGVVPADLLD